MLNKIAICGFTEHRTQAPFRNPEWELWGLNDLYFEFVDVPWTRVRWFQIHDWKRAIVEPRPPSIADYTEGPPHPRDPNHVAWLREASQRCPVYLMKPAPEVPDAVVLPREEIYDYFRDANGKPIKYFTNTISWMIAKAIMELAPLPEEYKGVWPRPRPQAIEGATIGVFGVDMMVSGGQGSEYGWQRPSCEWLLGWAAGLGIGIVVPKESELLKTAWDYGDEAGEYFRQLLDHRRTQMSTQRGHVTSELRRLEAAANELTGWINCADQMLRNHVPGDPGDEPYLLGRAPVPDSHKPLGPGITAHGPTMDNGEGG